MDKMQICFQTTKKSILKYREKNAIEMTGYKEIEIQDELVYVKKYITGNQFFQWNSIYVEKWIVFSFDVK